MAKEFEHRGIRIVPDYESANGTGKQCQTLQGWRVHIGKPRSIWGGFPWAASKKDAREKVDSYYKYTEMEPEQISSNVREDFLLKVCEIWPDRSKNIKRHLELRKIEEECVAQEKSDAARMEVNDWMDKYESMTLEDRFWEVAKLLQLDGKIKD